MKKPTTPNETKSKYFSFLGQLDEQVWIKVEQTDGESTTYFHIKSEEGISITDADPFTETATYTVKEISPEIGIVKSEICDDGDEFILPTDTKNEKNKLKMRKRRSISNAVIKCDECGKVFSQRSSLNRHMFMHTGEKPFECDICGLKFAQKAHIKPHKLTHTGETPYECNECHLKFRYSRSLKNHKKMHSMELKMNENHGSTGSWSIKSENSGDDAECILSTAINVEIRSPKIRRRRQVGEPQSFSCVECGKIFPRKRSLIRHMFMHTGERPFECDICGLRFAQKGHVKPHKRKHTGETPYPCDECDMKFMYSKSLKRHKKVHCPENEVEAAKQYFYCDECGAIFAGNHTLKMHKRKHAGEAAPFKCDECGKEFFRSDHLNRHMRMHTGERPFECDICGMKFTQKAHVKPHKETHNTDRAFPCEECGRKFACNASLRKHKKTHVFSCSICKINYDREVDLVRHMEEEHPSANEVTEAGMSGLEIVKDEL